MEHPTFSFTPTVKWVTINARSMQTNQDNRTTTLSAYRGDTRKAPVTTVLLVGPENPAALAFERAIRAVYAAIDPPETEETLS